MRSSCDIDCPTRGPIAGALGIERLALGVVPVGVGDRALVGVVDRALVVVAALVPPIPGAVCARILKVRPVGVAGAGDVGTFGGEIPSPGVAMAPAICARSFLTERSREWIRTAPLPCTDGNYAR